MFQVSRPYLGFRPDPEHFIVNFEGKIVKYAEKLGGGGGVSEKCNINILSK